MNQPLRSFFRIALCASLCLILGCAGHAPGAAGSDGAVHTVPIAVEQHDPGNQTPVPEENAASLPGGGTMQPGGLPKLAAAPAVGDGTLVVLFINVAKADAILVQYGAHRALIDTGTEESAAQLLGALAFLGVDSIDSLILTHTHKDHIGGVPALSRHVSIGQVYAARYSENKKNGGNRITEAVAEAGLPLTRLSAGERIPLAGDVSFEVLGPLVYNADNDNDNSLVLRLAVNGRVLLFTGDMQFAEEDTLLAANADVAADVLKVGNHGNPDATSGAFGRAVSPALAVVSTDTAVDEDSANPRVVAALPGASVSLTQDTVRGALLTVSPDGSMTLNNAAPVPLGAALSIVEVNKATQTVTLHHDGERLDVSGYMLLSERGGELFRFPAGSVLEPGATITVAGEGLPGDFNFIGEDAPWHKKKADTAVLYDRFGFAIASK